MYTVHTFGIVITVVASVDTEAWLSQVIVTITGQDVGPSGYLPQRTLQSKLCAPQHCYNTFCNTLKPPPPQVFEVHPI